VRRVKKKQEEKLFPIVRMYIDSIEACGRPVITAKEGRIMDVCEEKR